LSGRQLPLFTQQTAAVEREGSVESNQAAASISQSLQDSYEVGDAPLCHLRVTDAPQRQRHKCAKL
jgi:hypothetical protein